MRKALIIPSKIRLKKIDIREFEKICIQNKLKFELKSHF